MLSQLKTAAKVVGIKQSKKAIAEGKACAVYVASDAESRVVRPIQELCAQHGVELFEVATMQELGQAVGIDVGAAVVTQIAN